MTMGIADDQSCSSAGCSTLTKGNMLLQQSTVKQHALVSTNGSKSASTSSSSKPNILIIQPDDMYANFLGVDYAATLPPGESMPTAGSSLTSNMFKVATEGATFTHAYTASGMCSPSRAALLTGRYPSRNVYAEASTVSSKGSGVDTLVSVPTTFLTGADSSQNVMTALKASGYTTGMTGKWHLSPTSESGGTYADSYADQVANVKSRGFDYVDGLYITNLNTCGDDCSGFTHNMEWIVDKGLDFMSGAVAAGTPFFLYFNPTVPHTPKVKDALQESAYGTPAGDLSSLPDLTAYCSDCGLPSRTDVWKASAGSGGATDRGLVSGTYWIDSAVGSFYNFLSAKGVLDNTYIVILSDNGNSKGTVYEMGTRTIFFAKGPTITPGGTIDALVSSIDIAPTILEWAGSSAALDVDGVSLAGVASGSSSLGRDSIFLEMAYDRAVVRNDGMKLYVAGEGKYVNRLALSGVTGDYPAWGVEKQLYDLTSDGAEQTNLASSSSYATTLASLEALMEEHKAATLNAPAAEPTGECATWCPNNAKDWATKCGWAKCSGCSDCD